MKSFYFFIKSILIVILDLVFLFLLWVFLNLQLVSFPEEITPIVLTAIGTILAFLSGHYLYDEYKKPFLELVEFDKLIFPNETHWRIKIRNSGRSGAENCCGDVELIGKLPNIIIKVEGRVCWARISNPESLTVNADDSQFLNN